MSKEVIRVTVWRWRVLEKNDKGEDVWRELDSPMTIDDAREWVRRHGKHLSQVDDSAQEIEIRQDDTPPQP